MMTNAKVTIEANVKITDDIRKAAKEQYGFVDDQFIANQILMIIIDNGILTENRKINYWDGVAKLKNNIKGYKMEGCDE